MDSVSAELISFLYAVDQEKRVKNVAIHVLTQGSGKSVDSHVQHSRENPAVIADKPAISPTPRHISHQFE